MAKDPERARTTILDAADRLLRRGGGGTVDEVAREARCAKGLVHYHFKTKAGLLAAVATRLGEGRRTRWTEVFRASNPDAAIKRSWDLVVTEARDGTIRAWTALLAQREGVTDRAVSLEFSSFSTAIADGADKLLEALGLAPTVPTEELGLLLAGVVHGMGLLLESGTEPQRLQGAYAAAWLGVLSLTQPAAG
jgi:AcrR family transcriptional regulator